MVDVLEFVLNSRKYLFNELSHREMKANESTEIGKTTTVCMDSLSSWRKFYPAAGMKRTRRRPSGSVVNDIQITESK